MGGTDDEDNLVILTIKEHAEAHRQLWLKFHEKEDYIAWQALLGRKVTEKDRIELAQRGFQKFLKDEEKVSVWKNKISNTIKGRKLSDEHKKKVSIGLIKARLEGKMQNVKRQSKEFYRQNCINNKEILAEGRRNSQKWHDSMSSDSCRYKKMINNPKSIPIEIDGVMYPSRGEAMRKLGYTQSQLAKIINNSK